MENSANGISLTELKKLLDSTHQIVIIDVRSREEYEAKHISYAINIPLDKLKTKAKFFESDKIYVTACGKGGGRSIEASAFLNALNFNSYWLIGGTFGWFEI